ncbi:MAG: hypothetical protein QOF70_442 [Acetobacteraceae bacterium]|nr:hypothetical protein [Acetobacteraceae bacterium]
MRHGFWRVAANRLAHIRPIIPALTIAALGISLSLYAFFAWRVSEAAANRNDFSLAATARLDMMRRSILKPFDAMGYVENLIESVGPVDQPTFNRFAGEVLRENPQILQLIWAPVRAGAASAPFDAPAGFTTSYVLPAGADEIAGRDIGTLPDYGACLHRPPEFDAKTDRICVVSVDGGVDALVILAVRAFVPHTDDLPLSGAIVGRIHLKFATDANNLPNIEVVDLATPGGTNLLHPAEHSGEAVRAIETANAVSLDIHIGSETWRLVNFPHKPATEWLSWQSLGVLVACLAMTTNLTIYILLINRHRRRTEATVIDRTRELEAALGRVQSSEQRLQDYAAIASDWNWETDKDLRFTHVAVQVSQHQIEPGELIGLDRLTEDDAENEVVQRRELLSSHQIFRDLRYDYGTDRGLLTLSLSGLPIIAADGTFQGYRGSVRDITLQLQAEAKQRLAHWAAEQANRAKSNFLATMSHEIRTPMNGVLGMVQMLSDTALDHEQRRMCDLIYRSGNSLKQILNDILDYSKLEAGKITLEVIGSSLTEIVASVVDLMQGTAKAGGLSIELDTGDSLMPPVMTDPTRFRQVLFNLVSNAIKFSERGVVTIRLRGVDAGPNRLAITLAIIDQGIGISGEALRRLFARFSQADDSTTRRFGGTGLGLAITRELVTLMGGTIGVTSVPGQGTTFTIEMTLPIAEGLVGPTPQARWTEQAADARVLDILVAEDNEINREVIRGLLRDHRLTVVEDGHEAVEAARTGRFDLVLMDVMMPTMNGPQATAAIRALGPAGAALPIIALTANSMSGDRETYLAAGMTDYVSKPIDRHDLFDVIERVTGGPVMRPIAAGKIPAPPIAVTEAATLEIDDFIASLSLGT